MKCLAILIQTTRVTHRRTDRIAMATPVLSIASRR